MALALDPIAIVRLLAEPDRLRVCAALALGASTRQEVAAASGLSARQVDRALRRLLASGLVTQTGSSLRLVAEHFGEASRLAASGEGEQEAAEGDLPKEAAKVLRTFVRNGRLSSIPAARSKRLVLLDWLAQRFEPGRRYPEPEVNLLLSEVHPDVAALRRYLVDEGFLDRLHGEYWRTGGTFPVG
jgi:hypothetical protein